MSADDPSARIYIDQLLLKRKEENFRAGICLCSLPPGPLDRGMDEMLHADELAYYSTLKFEKRKRSYLVGRYAAKRAVAALIGERNLKSILIGRGVFNQPIVTHGQGRNIQVSISHCDERGAAVAFHEAHPLAIDVEKVNAHRRAILEEQMTNVEQDLVKDLPGSYDRMITLLWTVKEALSKVLKTGLTTPFHVFEVNHIARGPDYTICFFSNFGQYKAVSFDWDDSVYSIISPKKTEFAVSAALPNLLGSSGAEQIRVVRPITERGDNE